DRQRHLGQSALAESADELRAHFVAGREQKEIEEDELDDRGDVDVELPDDDTRDEGADDVAEAEGADPDPPENEPQRQGQEDGQLGVLAQRRDDVVQEAPHVSAPSAGARVFRGSGTARDRTPSKSLPGDRDPPASDSRSPRTGGWRSIPAG